MHIKPRGISIEIVEHNNGSPGNGAYWGYLVARRGGNSMTYYGRDTESNEKGLHHVPFRSQHEAMTFANSLPSDPEEQEDHEHDEHPHEDPWVDIGGEG